MPEDPDPNGNPRQSAAAGFDERPLGFLSRSLLDSLLGFLQARIQLLRIESREASTAVRRRFAFYSVASSLLFFAYLLLLAGGVSLLAKHNHIPWEYVAIGLAGCHFVAGVIFLAIARAKFRKPFFDNSLRELDKDRQWLTKHPHQNKPN